MSIPKILVVDDEPHIREVLSSLLNRAGYSVRCSSSGDDAFSVFQEEPADVCLVDIKMPGMSGIDLLSLLKGLDPGVAVLVMTAFDTWETAVEAMRLGAFSYVRKPFDNEELRSSIARALDQKRMARKAREQADSVVQTIIGNSPEMEDVFRLIRSAAPTDITVVVEGESGTGKELVARALHYGSSRSEGNLIAVNCAAFPDTLLESEFFGYKKGAFTGAAKDKRGLLDVADKGSLFVDEIGDMPGPMQIKFLRVLETGEFTPLGDTSVTHVDVRLIAATNKSLESEVEKGAFREDLFHRINVITIRLPALRKRKGDIPLLSGHFIAKHCAKIGKEVIGIKPEAMSVLMAYDWPGNVRELENAIEAAIAMAEDKELGVSDFAKVRRSEGKSPDAGTNIALPADLEGILVRTEMQYIEAALAETRGNITKAADILGVTFRRLRYRIKKLGIRAAHR